MSDNIFFQTTKDVLLEGNKYLLWIVAERFVEESGLSDNKRYEGSAEIRNKTTDEVFVFNFITLKARDYRIMSTDDPGYKGYGHLLSLDYNPLDFKDNILARDDSEGKTIPLILANMVRPGDAVDLFVCKAIIEARTRSKLPVPKIVLPILSTKELISKGLMAEPEGQIQLLSVA